jgi:hypothetical protein
LRRGVHGPEHDGPSLVADRLDPINVHSRIPLVRVRPGGA